MTITKWMTTEIAGIPLTLLGEGQANKDLAVIEIKHRGENILPLLNGLFLKHTLYSTRGTEEYYDSVLDYFTDVLREG